MSSGSVVRSARGTASHDAGAAAVEMGIAIPLLLLIVSAVVYFGVVFNTQLTLNYAAREGVRVYALTGDEAAAESTARDASRTVLSELSPTVAMGTVTGGSYGTTPACDPAALPPGAPPQAWLSARTTLQVPFAFGDTLTFNLVGRAVMRCGG
jgi:Flp pilus assembly protein TadG